MRTVISQFLIFFIFFFIFENLNAQINSMRDKIFPYIFTQISSGDTSISILRDDLRLSDPNKSFSVFLLYGENVVDSLSLDNISSSGAKPKKLFFWKTKDGINLGCLEYNAGSGIGRRIINNTKLLIFDTRNKKLKLLSSIETDSTFYDYYEKTSYEVSTRIYQYYDTLYVIRHGWNITENKNHNLVKTNDYNEFSKIIWEGKEIRIIKAKGTPFFIKPNKK